MITKAYLGDKRVLQITHNGKKLINVPKLIANFTTGTYKSNGDNKTFTDLFTFSRAGKAWLVKDAGLVEYATDVPRFDNGLLIEKAATNLATSGHRQSLSSEWVGNTVKIKKDGSTTQVGWFGVTVNLIKDQYVTSSISIKTENSLFVSTIVGDAGINSFSVNLITGSNTFGNHHPLTLDPSMISEKQGSFVDIKFTRSASQTVVTGVRLNIANPVYNLSDNTIIATVKYEQHEVGKVASSYVPTTTAVVTRPADYLANKIVGTTLTGDWDSTLNLSLVNGQIVHTGYGRIRSLEIN